MTKADDTPGDPGTGSAAAADARGTRRAGATVGRDAHDPSPVGGAVARDTRGFFRAGAAVALLLLWAAAGLASPARAQEPAEFGLPVEVADSPGDSLELIDRVVAIVGDTAILLSELREEVIRLRTQIPDLPTEGSPEFESFVRQLLGRMVDQAILLQHAKRDPNLAIDDEEVAALVEERFRQVRANFSSDEELQRAVEQAGMNMFQYRQMLRGQARAELLLDRYRQSLLQSGELPGAAVTEAEVREYFERNTTGQTRPATVSFARLLVDPGPTPEADSAARAEARKALEEIYGGEDFEVVARRYSDDEGTRAQGGDLGWLRRSDVVKGFGDAAWSAQAATGRAIGPVKSRFGYHIIKVENVRAGERKLRHILVRPEITEQDVRRARERAEALADSLRAGSDPRKLAERNDLPEENDVVFEDVQVDQIANRFGEVYQQRLGIPIPGDVVGPFETEGPTGQPTFAVVHVTEYRPAGDYELDDALRDRIRANLMQQKQFQLYLEQLRDETFVEVYL